MSDAWYAGPSTETPAQHFGLGGMPAVSSALALPAARATLRLVIFHGRLVAPAILTILDTFINHFGI